MWSLCILAGKAISQGIWSPNKNLLLSPTSAAHINGGKILVWSANSATYYQKYSKGELYQIINSDGTFDVSQGLLSTSLPSMFCSGITILANGDVLVNGGGDINAAASAIFHVSNNTFSAASDMTIPRGYNSNIMLTNGLIFTIGGSFNRPWGGRNAEVFDYGTNKWIRFDKISGDIIGERGTGFASIDPDGIFRSDNHAWLASWHNKKDKKHVVFHLGPTPKIHIIDATNAPGGMVQFDTRPTPYSMNAACVMMSPGIYFAAGGALAYSVNGHAANKDAVIINLLPITNGNSTKPNYTIIPMKFPRAFANAVVMPGGKVFVVGGQTRTFIFQDDFGVLEPEIYDPLTKTFTLGPKMTVARNYHSWALLMYDGRIMVGGGGLCVATNRTGTVSCPKRHDRHIHNDVEIFSPFYVTKTRPKLRTTKKSKLLELTKSINVKTNCRMNCTFEMFKRNSATHSVNNDQIRVPLRSYLVGSKKQYKLWIHPIYQDWVTSGHYMLFVLEKDIPSVSIDIFVDASRR